MKGKIVKAYGTHFGIRIDGKDLNSTYSTIKRAREVALIRGRVGNTIEIYKILEVVNWK